MPLFRRHLPKDVVLDNILKDLANKGNFELVVVSDHTGLIVADYNEKDLPPKYLAALSSIIYSSAKKSSEDLLMGTLNYIIINTAYGEILLMPIEIEDYSKDFLLSAIINKEAIKDIRSKERSMYEEMVNLFNKYTFSGFKIRRLRKATNPTNTSIERLNAAVKRVKDVFT